MVTSTSSNSSAREIAPAPPLRSIRGAPPNAQLRVRGSWRWRMLPEQAEEQLQDDRPELVEQTCPVDLVALIRGRVVDHVLRHADGSKGVLGMVQMIRVHGITSVVFLLFACF